MGAHSSFRGARRADRASPRAPRRRRNRIWRSLRQPKERVARKQPTVFRPPQRSALGQKFPNLYAKPARNRRDIRHLCANQGFTSVCQAEQFVIREGLRAGILGCHARSSPCRRRNPHFLIRERLRTGIPECRTRSSPCRKRNPHFLIRERLQAGIPECHARSSPCRKRNPHFLIRERLQTGIPGCRARSSLSCHSVPGRARPPGRAVR